MSQNLKLKPGDTFGYLTVLGWEISSRKYKCSCICGKEVLQRCYFLKSGKVKSCGCMSRELTARAHHKPDFETAKNLLFNKYATRASESGRQFELDKDEFLNLVSKPCHYCGVSYSNEMRPPREYKYAPKNPYRYNGIDRVDNSKGYVSENCVSCCDICNKAKRDLTVEEWTSWLNRLIKFQTSPEQRDQAFLTFSEALNEQL